MKYKIVFEPGCQEKAAPLFSAAGTGRTYQLGSVVEITKIQKNIPLVAEWGQLVNGNWIAVIYNARTRAKPVEEQPEPEPQPIDPTKLTYRIRWDDELPEFNYMSRTAGDTWGWGPQTVAVFRHYPVTRYNAGEFRIDLTAIEWFTHEINPTDRQWRYYTGPSAGMFNRVGWPSQMNIVMSGNLLQGLEVMGNWLKFKTLTIDTVRAGILDKRFIHHWSVVGAGKEGTTHAEQVGDPQMTVQYPVVTKEGFAYIPIKYVARV